MLEAVQRAIPALLWPFGRLFRPDDPFSLASLCGAILVTSGILAARTSSGGGIAGAFRALMPRGSLSHRSTALDFKVYWVNGLLIGTSFGYLTIGAEAWRAWTNISLQNVLGERAPSDIPHWVAAATATGVGVIAFDFGYYVAHWLEHHTFLWRFHRKHHSATILTPLTGAREHPVDALVSVSLIALCVGASNGALGYAIGPLASPYLLFHTNCVLVVYFFTLQHLRHSQVWAPFTGALGCVFQSPAHHQLHHSADPEHFDKNLGFSLAIFDAMFGTLRVPRADETVDVFGVADAPDAEPLRDFYFGPFGFAQPVAEAASDAAEDGEASVDGRPNARLPLCESG